MAVCSQIYTKNINTVCRQKREMLNVKAGVAQSESQDLKC
jgi:hypothetical protein